MQHIDLTTNDLARIIESEVVTLCSVAGQKGNVRLSIITQFDNHPNRFRLIPSYKVYVRANNNVNTYMFMASQQDQAVDRYNIEARRVQ